MTLEEVARACDPPTTAQTIGRLETGTRTVSIGWLNRIAAALGVGTADLVRLPERSDVPVVALLGPQGAMAPRRTAIVVPPQPAPDIVVVQVTGAIGDYRSGDELWCRRLSPPDFGQALNRDVLLPGRAGRFRFAHLMARDLDRSFGRLRLLALDRGARASIVDDPPWLAVAIRLVRSL